MLYTSENVTTGQALAANLLTSPSVDNAALLANVTTLFSQGLNMVRTTACNRCMSATPVMDQVCACPTESVCTHVGTILNIFALAADARRH